jgi:hypothetical protein
MEELVKRGPRDGLTILVFGYHNYVTFVMPSPPRRNVLDVGKDLQRSAPILDALIVDSTKRLEIVSICGTHGDFNARRQATQHDRPESSELQHVVFASFFCAASS